MKEHIPEMLKMRQDGKTFKEIGNRFGVTHQRIEQMITEKGKARIRHQQHTKDSKVKIPCYLCERNKVTTWKLTYYNEL